MSDKKRVKAVAKISTGIEGFDDLTFGGLPRHCDTFAMFGNGAGPPQGAIQLS